MILNKTRKTTLCKKTEKAISGLSRAKGLMFRGSLKGGLIMIFDNEIKSGIWTFGMRIPIDIVWIDSKNRIVSIKENAKPWRYMGYPEKPAKMVLELNSGIVKKTRTCVGDLLKISL